jgi:hypothetical protein
LCNNQHEPTHDHYLKYCEETKINPRRTSWFDHWRPIQKLDVISLGLVEESDILNDKYSSPIVLETSKGLEINPNLKFIQFYKVFDPVTTYQHISMYFGNKFFNEPKMTPISDKDRIQQHGFDEKSFRRAKSSSK